MLWGVFLLAQWTSLPIPSIITRYDALVAFIILSIQVFAHSEMKKLITFKDKEMNMIAIIAVITVICGIFANSRVGAFFTVLNFCLLWYISDKWVWSDVQILTLSACLIIIFIRWSFLPKPVGFNSNTIGTITTFSAISIIAVIDYFLYDRKWKYGLQIPLLIISFLQVLKYHGRATFLCILIYTILKFLVPKKWWESDVLFKVLCFLSTFGSVIFVYFYTIIWLKSDSNFIIPYFNKSIFSGREKIWYEIWNKFKHQPLIGTGSNISLESWFEVNIHNAMYDILMIHGIIVFLLLMFYIIYKLLKLYKKNMDNPCFITCAASFFCVFFESYFDMDLVWIPEMLVWCFVLVVLNSSRLKKINDKIM